MNSPLSLTVRLSKRIPLRALLTSGAAATSVLSALFLYAAWWSIGIGTMLVGVALTVARLLLLYGESQATALTTLSERQLALVAARAERLDFRANSILFRQDASADCLYLVVRGEVEVLRRDSAGVYEPLASVGAGSWLGEVGLLGRTTYGVAAKAASAVEVLAVDRNIVAALLDQSDDAAGFVVAQLRRLTLRRRIDIVTLLPHTLAHDIPVRLTLLRDAFGRIDRDTALWLLGSPLAPLPF